MGLSSALATAMSGLRANQAALSIVSSNVANAQTPGYVTQNVNQIEVAHRRCRLAASRSPASIASSICTCRASCARKPPAAPMPTRCPTSWASCKASMGPPAARHAGNRAQQFHLGAAGAIDKFGQPVRADRVAFTAAQIAGAATQYHDAGHSVAAHQCRTGYRHRVSQANAAMTQIATINTRLQGLSPTDPAAATLEDQRDNAINTLSQLMDIRAVTDIRQPGQRLHQFRRSTGRRQPGLDDVVQFTGNVDRRPRCTTRIPTKSGVGSLTIQLPNGATTDLIATNAFSSGTDRRRSEVAR